MSEPAEWGSGKRTPATSVVARVIAVTLRRLPDGTGRKSNTTLCGHAVSD